MILFGQFRKIWNFLIENGKIKLVRASMVITYYIKLFRTGADRHNGILMSLPLLVTKTMKVPHFKKMSKGVIKHIYNIYTIINIFSSEKVFINRYGPPISAR